MKNGGARFGLLCLVSFAYFLSMVSLPVNAALLTYSFDDGYISTYSDAFPILQKYGQVGTINVVSNTVQWADDGGTVKWVNSSQLRQMQSSGWEICSHSKSHPRFSKIPQTYNDEPINNWELVQDSVYTYKSTYAYEQLPFLMENGDYLKRKSSIDEVEITPGSYYFDTSTHSVYVHTLDDGSPIGHEIRADSVQRELDLSRSELENMGLTINGFVSPYNDWNKERALIASRYYCSAAAGPVSGELGNILPVRDPYSLLRRAPTSVDDVLRWIEEAISENRWLILVFHDISEDGWSAADLDAVASWVASQDVQVVTQTQGVQYKPVPAPPPSMCLAFGVAILFYAKRKTSYKTLKTELFGKVKAANPGKDGGVKKSRFS